MTTTLIQTRCTWPKLSPLSGAPGCIRTPTPLLLCQEGQTQSRSHLQPAGTQPVIRCTLPILHQAPWFAGGCWWCHGVRKVKAAAIQPGQLPSWSQPSGVAGPKVLQAHTGQLLWYRSKSQPLSAGCCLHWCSFITCIRGPSTAQHRRTYNPKPGDHGTHLPTPQKHELCNSEHNKMFFCPNITAAPLWLLLSRGTFDTCDIMKLQSPADHPPSSPQQS